MSAQNFIDGILREQWDDSTRIYTAWDTNGVQTEQRPYTANENLEADARAQSTSESTNESTIETHLEEDLVAMQAILDQTNAALRQDPAQEIKDIAKAVRRLIKKALNDYSVPE